MTFSYEQQRFSMGEAVRAMNSEFAEKFYDELEEAIREERPLRLVHVGMVTPEKTLTEMWEQGSLCL